MALYSPLLKVRDNIKRANYEFDLTLGMLSYSLNDILIL